MRDGSLAPPPTTATIAGSPPPPWTSAHGAARPGDGRRPPPPAVPPHLVPVGYPHPLVRRVAAGLLAAAAVLATATTVPFAITRYRDGYVGTLSADGEWISGQSSDGAVVFSLPGRAEHEQGKAFAHGTPEDLYRLADGEEAYLVDIAMLPDDVVVATRDRGEFLELVMTTSLEGTGRRPGPGVPATMGGIEGRQADIVGDIPGDGVERCAAVVTAEPPQRLVLLCHIATGQIDEPTWQRFIGSIQIRP